MRVSGLGLVVLELGVSGLGARGFRVWGLGFGALEVRV